MSGRSKREMGIKLYVLRILLIGVGLWGGCFFFGPAAEARTTPEPAAAWSSEGPGSPTVTEITYGVRMSYDWNDSGAWSGQSWEFRATAAQTGTLHYRWHYSGLHAWFEASAKVVAFRERDGIRTTNALFEQAVHGEFSGSGISSLELAEGDVYGFLIYGINFDYNSFLRGALDVQTSPSIEAALSGTLGGEGWYTSDVDLNWAVADPAFGQIDASGCEPITVAEDTSAAGATYTCTASSLGGTSAHSVTVKRDTTAPVTTDDAPQDGAAAEATIRFTASDAGSGVAQTYFRVNGGELQEGDSVRLTASGLHTLTYWSVDRAGNVEEERQRLIEVRGLPIPGEDGLHIGTILSWLEQGTIGQQDLNGDGVFDKLDLQILLRAITPKSLDRHE